MSKVEKIIKIREFTNEGRTYGVYSVFINGSYEVFIKNDKSVGVVHHSLGEPASKCVSEIRDDVKLDFNNFLDTIKS